MACAAPAALLLLHNVHMNIHARALEASRVLPNLFS